MATITSTSWEYLSRYICTETSRIIYHFVSNSKKIVNFTKYYIDFSIYFFLLGKEVTGLEPSGISFYSSNIQSNQILLLIRVQ